MTGHLPLVLSLCRGDDPLPHAEDRLGVLADETSRRELIELAGSHGVLGLVLSRLVRALEPEHLCTPHLAAVFERLRVRATVLQLRCDRVVGLLERSGIRPVVLKGAGMARAYYADPTERDLRDLDLLVDRDDIPAAVRCLEDHGYAVPSNTTIDVYRKLHFHVPLRHRDSHCVELHWTLTMPSSPFSIDPRAIFERAITVERAGSASLRIPGPEHLMLHCVIQNLQEDFSRLARTVDVDRIVASRPDFDWKFLATEARRSHLRSATALSLQLARTVLQSPIPVTELRLFVPGRVVRYNIGLLRPDRHLLQAESQRRIVWGDLLGLWLTDRRSHRVRALLFPPPSRAFSPSGRSPGLLFRLSRIGKILLFQSYLCGKALAALTSSSRSAQIRFWSSHARSSDLL